MRTIETIKNGHQIEGGNRDRFESYLTGLSIFLMGLIDAFAVIVYDTLVSAQTGNLVTIAQDITDRNWSGVGENLLVFLGFAVGAFLGKAAQEIFKDSHHREKTYLAVQSVMLLFLSIYQTTIDGSILVILLAVLAGYDLALFRHFGKTRVNNGVMTGNTKAMMSSLFQAVYYRKERRKMSKEALNLFFAVLLFVGGVVFGTFLVLINEYLALWVSFILVVGSLIVMSLKRRGRRNK